MRSYENVFIVRQDLSPTQVQTLSDTYAKLIADDGGEVSKSEYSGLRHLAYPIRKNSMGHYILMNVTAKPATILELERKMRLNEDILRFLTVSVETLDPNPSALTHQVRVGREPYNPNRGGGRYRKDEDGAGADADVDVAEIVEEEL
jgi:small subunit ribosomal protein S6